MNCLEEQFNMVRSRGLIGDERDVPYNPVFLKSGYSKVMIQRYENTLTLCANRTVLDAGCGLGWGTDIIRKKAAMIIGIDSDPGTIKFCGENYACDNVLFQVMDLRKITFHEGIFDAALLMEVLEHMTLEDGYKCLSGIARVLSPEGVLVGTTYIPSTERERQLHLQSSDNKDHLHIYTKDDMEKLLSTYFERYEIAGVTTFVAAYPKQKEGKVRSGGANG